MYIRPMESFTESTKRISHIHNNLRPNNFGGK